MSKLEELKILKAMYLQDLEDIHVYEANPHMKELRQFELESQIVAIMEAIEYLERANQSKKKVIIGLGITLIISFIIYLIF
jgi:hypothetical protein